MADSFLPYKNPDTTDKKLDSESLTVGSDTVERERVQVAGKGAAEIQDVKNAKPAQDAYAGISALSLPESFLQQSAEVLPEAVLSGQHKTWEHDHSSCN